MLALKHHFPPDIDLRTEQLAKITMERKELSKGSEMKFSKGSEINLRKACRPPASDRSAAASASVRMV